MTESMGGILADMERFHDLSVAMLAGVIAGTLAAPKLYTRDRFIEILKEDIEGSAKILTRHGRRPNAHDS